MLNDDIDDFVVVNDEPAELCVDDTTKTVYVTDDDELEPHLDDADAWEESDEIDETDYVDIDDDEVDNRGVVSDDEMEWTDDEMVIVVYDVIEPTDDEVDDDAEVVLDENDEIE